ncbi:GDSL esterase/lipase [Quillaja saponaria]|uniref:GDSL esterase/lipase n=1 Tax=Quillaja saponaria TaxID=32244 RepID=A0AAD7PXS0_QUISA|nr:GDSL esterase/lipase [Quillaja saponaria]
MRETYCLQIIIFSLIFLHFLGLIHSLPLAPALYVFGDSLFDSGNNNILPTLAKADYLPYGVNFAKGVTGRFTNGRTVADFIAEFLGLPYSPPYMSFRSGSTTLTGLNYASGSCGILPETGTSYGKCLSLQEQINLFEWTIERDLPKNSTELYEYLSKSIFIFSVGSNDYINNYLDTKMYDTSKHYTPQTFAQLLTDKLSQNFERMCKLGARKIIMFEVGPVGCIPSISKRHKHNGQCVEEANQFVSLFNERLPAVLQNLTSSLPGSTFVLGHSNWLGYNAIRNPSYYGLKDTSNPCCTTWGNGTSGCIPWLRACPIANEHFFWDAFHLTEAAYSVIANRCFNDTSFCSPYNIQQLVQM